MSVASKHPLFCKNYGECPNAGEGPGREKPLEVATGEDPSCPLCGSLLDSGKERRNGKGRSMVPIVVGTFALFFFVLVVAALAWYLFTPPSPDKQMEKMLVEAFPWLKS
jgi:hypothetical protein